jgi:HK97 gp10 family phage protein
MPAGGRLEWDDGALRDLFESADGPVAPHGSHGNPSGFLRSSIGQQTGRDGEGVYVDVTAEADYALFVELGTSKMAAQPFLRPALDDL